MNLHLLLTGRCNLRCDYCYQTDRRVRRHMSGVTARVALDVVLGAGDPPHSVTLSGGEPYLSPTLIRKVVHAIRRRSRGGQPIECTVFSNGTLVTDSDVEFLTEHGVKLQVSFDGVSAAQDRRGPGTHGVILRLLRGALRRQPAWARDRLSVAMIVHGGTVPSLAQSLQLLLSTGVGEILVSPLLNHDPEWQPATPELLRQQVEEVVAASRRLWDRSRVVPVTFLRPEGRARGARRSGSGPLCGVASPDSVTVDPDGRAWACSSFVGSVQKSPPLARTAIEQLEIGLVRDPHFSRRLTDLPARAGKVAVLQDRDRKWSWRGRCRDCSAFDECAVCPATTTHTPGNLDPNRIPDHQCDFQFITTEARRRFLRETPTINWLLAPGLWTRRFARVS